MVILHFKLLHHLDQARSIEIVDTGKIASVGSTMWKDKNYTILNLPPILDGLVLGYLPYKLQPDLNLIIDIDGKSTVYMAFHSKSYSNNLTVWLQINGWTELDGDITYGGENGTGTLSHIWSKVLLSKDEISLTHELEVDTVAMFIKLGK